MLSSLVQGVAGHVSFRSRMQWNTSFALACKKHCLIVTGVSESCLRIGACIVGSFRVHTKEVMKCMYNVSPNSQINTLKYETAWKYPLSPMPQTVLFEASQASAVCPSGKSNVWVKMECGALVEWYWQGKTEAFGAKPTPFPLCYHKLHTDWSGVDPLCMHLW